MKDLFAIGIKVNQGINIKSRIFPMIMVSSNFKMVYFIMMVYCMFLIALRDFKFSRLGTMLWLNAISNSQDHGINVLRLLVSITLEYVKEFAGSCNVCVRTKHPRHHLHGLLKPLLIHTSPLSSISMDFITNLPLFNSYTPFWWWWII